MAPEQEPIIELRKEHEKDPKILVTFHGYIHDPLNYQGVPKVLNALSLNLQHSTGKSVLWIEQSGMHTSHVEKLKESIRRQGFVKTIIRGLDAKLQDQEIVAYEEKLAGKNMQEVIDSGLIPMRYLQWYFLSRGFDQLRSRHKLDIEIESHSRDTLKKCAEINRQGSALSSQAEENWGKGQFADFLDKIRRANILMYENGLLRERDIIKEIEQASRLLLRTQSRGSIFILMGEAHAPIVDIMSGKSGQDLSVRYESNIGFLEGSELPYGRVLKGLRGGQDVPDLINSQAFVAMSVMGEIISKAYDKDDKRKGEIAANYESILLACETIAARLSLTQMRELCERHTPLREFFAEQDPKTFK